LRIDEARDESQRQFATHCVRAKLSYNEVQKRQKTLRREFGIPAE
jgi:hypothetical protein